VSRIGREVYRVGGALLGWLSWIALLLVWGVLVVPVTLLLLPLSPRARDSFASLTHSALRAYIAGLSFARIRVENADNGLEGPRILVVNHQSRLDSPVLLSIEPRLLGPVRGYMLRVPIVATIIRLLGFFDTDEFDASALDAMNRAALQIRSSGGALLFYPEGTRSKTGEIGPFRRGAFRIAFDHSLPIQPVVIDGLDVAFPPDHWIPPVYGRCLVRIRYLEPLRPPYGAGSRRDVVRKLTERVRNAMIEELARMRKERAERSTCRGQASGFRSSRQSSY